MLKRILAVVVMVLAFAVGSQAAVVSLTFEWDPNTETDLAGYRLYTSQTSGAYVQFIMNPNTPNLVEEVGKVTTVTVQHEMPVNTTAYFTLSAYDTMGNESFLSNEVAFFLSEGGQGVPPRAPSLRLKSWVVVSSNP